MLDMNAFNKIFEVPVLHNKGSTPEVRVVSPKKVRATYEAIDTLGIATVKEILKIVDFGKSSVRSAINKLILNDRVEENQTKIIGTARVTDYKIKGLR